MSKYRFVVFTGSADGSVSPFNLPVPAFPTGGSSGGTNSKIYIKLKDKKGVETQQYRLDNQKDNFEDGKKDFFVVDIVETLANISQLYLYSDGSGNQPGWDVGGIFVQREDTKEVWNFAFNADGLSGALGQDGPQGVWLDPRLIQPL